MTLYPLVQQFVTDSFAGRPAIIKHLLRTEYWARSLRPQADEALRCAAVAHDIERSEPDSELNLKFRRGSFRDAEALNYHQQRGAEIVGNYLRQQGANATEIARIQSLIAHHEIGGDEDQNFIKDVDSLSFLENNLGYFIDNLLPSHGPEQVIAKFQWMYDRISEQKIKELAQPFYLSTLRELERYQS